MSARDEYIAGLRQLADWLEEHPAARVPFAAAILLPLKANAKVEEYAEANGLDIAYDTDGNASAEAQFGPITYRAYGYADWDQHIADHTEKRARAWAEEHGMTLQPAEEQERGESS